MPEQTKIRINVSEMARMVGLSRSRFYQLIGSAFPHPRYDVETKQPFYDEELQQACLEVRRRNCGVDGRAIMFNARKNGMTPRTRERQRLKPQTQPAQNGELLDNVRALGLTTATTDQIASAIAELYPGGTGSISETEVLRAVFVYLERQESGS